MPSTTVTCGRPAEISPDQNFSVGPPSLAIWNGEVHMVWAADTTLNLYGDTIMHVAWRPGDSAATLLLNAAPLPVQSGHLDAADIAFDAQGRMHMVWDGNISAAPNVHTAYEIFYTVETNGSWSAPVNISNTSEYCSCPPWPWTKLGVSTWPGWRAKIRSPAATTSSTTSTTNAGTAASGW
ncbi:MAG: hypothetical protein R2856_14130 [Caldilineaceae bacterium]